MDRILCGCAVRHLSLRFCIYGKPEGFKKGYTFSIVFSVTSFFSKQTTKKKNPDRTTNPKPRKRRNNEVIHICSTTHKMAA